VESAALESGTSQVGSKQMRTQEHIAYWERQLWGAPILSLPTDRPGPATPGSCSAFRLVVVDESLSKTLRQLSQREQVPLPALLLSACHVLLLRYTSQEDIVIACSFPDFVESTSGGAESGQKEFFSRVALSGDPTFRWLLKQVAATVSAVPRCPFTLRQLVGELTSLGIAPGLFRVSFSYRTSHTGRNTLPSREVVADVAGDLHFQVECAGDELELRFFYTPESFEAASVNRMLGSLQTILRAIVANPDEQLWRLPILSERDRRQILVDWNQTGAEYPREKCLHELVEAQAEHVPEKPAVVLGDARLTYGELNSRANQWAHYLRSRGVGPNVRVGICLPPALDFAIATLAVLKSGGACVPLDTKYPADRLAYMLQDVQARLVITEKGLLPEAVLSGSEALFLADNAKELVGHPLTNPGSGATPGDVAYVLYTSGSTGKPRGVLLTHAGLVNYNFNAARTYSVTPDDRVLQFCSISFDIAIEEMFITWLGGATLVLKSDDMPLAVPDFLEWIAQQRVTILDLPTAYWHEWANQVAELKRPAPKNLRLVIVGGEKASARAYSAWRKSVGPDLRWFNSYGPTEASVCATGIFDPQEPVPDNIPIGRPLPNCRVYLLDRHLNLVPMGTPGELYIGGVGVAQGYLNCPELTAERFISDPFSSEPAARMYKTGDLARYLPSGEIEFLGRTDDQVKIRGFRVELGEIDGALANHPSVREAAVIAREDVPGDKRLVAYFVPVRGANPTPTELRRYLRKELPEFMVPSAFVMLEGMPLTPNGKIDRRGLPAPEAEALLEESAAVTDPLQSQLVRIWEAVLGKKPIGIKDNFFDLGGHSLLAARLMHRTGQALGKTLPLAMLFQAPTVEQLAAALRQNGWAQHFSSVVPIQPSGSHPPFFCIHGVGGNVLGFHELASRMAPDYPFFGLQSQGLDGTRPCHRRMEEMAAHYLNEIRNVQPKGPYFLGGFSFGGLVAYEMAQQLCAQGEEVGLLVLFDTYPGNVKRGTAFLARALLIPSWQHWFRDLPRAVRKRVRRTVLGWLLPRVLRDVRDSNVAASDNYVLRPYPGKVTLLRATQKLARGAEDPHATWTKLAASLEIHLMTGDHYDMLVAPQVDNLAARLKSCMDNAQAECEQGKLTFRSS